MSNENEKITINLGVVELAQIDVLVEQGIYSNRSDFIRTSVRAKLDNHKNIIENILTPVTSKARGHNWKYNLGIIGYCNKDFKTLDENNETLSISVIGMLVIDKNTNPELFARTVKNVTVRGKLIASDVIKEIINRMN